MIYKYIFSSEVQVYTDGGAFDGSQLIRPALSSSDSLQRAKKEKREGNNRQTERVRAVRNSNRTVGRVRVTALQGHTKDSP